MIQNVYTCDGCGHKVALAPSPTEMPPWWIELFVVRALGVRPPAGAPHATDTTSELFCSVACLAGAARPRFEALLGDAIGKGDGDPLDKAILSGVRIERKQLSPPMAPRATP